MILNWEDETNLYSDNGNQGISFCFCQSLAAVHDQYKNWILHHPLINPMHLNACSTLRQGQSSLPSLLSDERGANNPFIFHCTDLYLAHKKISCGKTLLTTSCTKYTIDIQEKWHSHLRPEILNLQQEAPAFGHGLHEEHCLLHLSLDESQVRSRWIHSLLMEQFLSLNYRILQEKQNESPDVLPTPHRFTVPCNKCVLEYEVPVKTILVTDSL